MSSFVESPRTSFVLIFVCHPVSFSLNQQWRLEAKLKKKVLKHPRKKEEDRG